MLSSQERDALIDRYARGAGLLAAALEKAPAEALKWKPAPDKWSVHEIVCHCADSEVNASGRIRYVVAEKQPTIQGYDQDEWARALDYHALPLEPALRCLEGTRAHTAELIRRLPEEAWQREGRHSESGRYTAEDWLRIYADHLEKHAGQIERTLASWRARPGA
ncbi:MAG TPA: DinB family protein [Vicinamibacteria bacterium]|nr:DinB family protein [Vicinamibacteria bacterium]